MLMKGPQNINSRPRLPIPLSAYPDQRHRLNKRLCMGARSTSQPKSNQSTLVLQCTSENDLSPLIFRLSSPLCRGPLCRFSSHSVQICSGILGNARERLVQPIVIINFIVIRSWLGLPGRTIMYRARFFVYTFCFFARAWKYGSTEIRGIDISPRRIFHGASSASSSAPSSSSSKPSSSSSAPSSSSSSPAPPSSYNNGQILIPS